jgi:hypothetical protein
VSTVVTDFLKSPLITFPTIEIIEPKEYLHMRCPKKDGHLRTAINRRSMSAAIDDLGYNCGWDR